MDYLSLKDVEKGFYQSLIFREIASRIQIDAYTTVPRIILSISPCRSGSTVMLRAFGAAGIPSHFQQLKNVLRWELMGENKPWSIPQSSSSLIYLKETLGPYLEIESYFNPLEVLLKSNYPPEKLQVLILARTPISTWASWDEKWRGRTNVQNLILAYKTTEKIRQQAYQLGIPVTTYVFEAIRDNEPAFVIKNLFEKLGISYSDYSTSKWDELPAFGSPSSNIILPEEPAFFYEQHESVRKSRYLMFRSRETSFPFLNEYDINRLRMENLFEIYDKWRRTCEMDLHIKIRPDTDWGIWFSRYTAKLVVSPSM